MRTEKQVREEIELIESHIRASTESAEALVFVRKLYKLMDELEEIMK